MRWKYWFGAAIILLTVSWAQPSRAAEWLYPASAGRGHVGRPAILLPGVRVLSAAQRLLLPPNLRRLAQPNLPYHALFVPNDPDFSQQWNFTAINIPAAWDADTIDPTGGGDPRVIVAVLDSGFASAAPDYSGLHLWTNGGEVAGDGIDNDHDGLVDDTHGWDFVNGDNLPADDNGHGTHVTGTIAESTNNGVAAAGIAYQTTIMPLKVLDSQGDGSTTTIAAAVTYAADHGATIINLSLGGTQDDPILHQAIQAAVSQGVIVVAAAGNSGAATLNYPARYEETIAVSAVQPDMTRPSYANYGPGLDLMAPGGNNSQGIIQQTCSTKDCTSFSSLGYVGTSQSTAHVSGVAALLAACGLPVGQISSVLASTATDEGPAGYDTDYGAGLINAAAALQAAGCQAKSPSPPSNLQVHSATGLARLLTDSQAYAFRQPEFSWSGTAVATYRVSWQKSGHPTSTVQQVATTFSPTLSDEGTYIFSVQSTDGLGQLSSALTFHYVFHRAVLGIAGSSQIRLYRDNYSKLRQFSSPAGPATIASGRFDALGNHRLILSYSNHPSTSTVLTTRGQPVRALQPFGRNFHGIINTAVLDNASGGATIVTATATQGAELHWYSASGHSFGRQLLYQTYRGGLALASGDVNGDGHDELIVAQVAGPEIRIYDDHHHRQKVLAPAGRSYHGGWTITTVDLDGDGHEEIVAVGVGALGRRPLYILTSTGAVVRHWTLSTKPYTGPIEIVGTEWTGDGYDRLLVAGTASASFLQQWSLTGKKEGQRTLTNIHGFSLAAID